MHTVRTTQEQRREAEIQSEMDRCVHFTGIQNTTCKAGVNVRALVGGPDFGWASRLPCLMMDAEHCEVACAARKFLTRLEAEAEVEKDHQQIKRVVKAANAARADATAKGLGIGNGGEGSIPCPTECGGTLRYRVASVNGHMAAACSTSKCVSWME